MIGSAPAIPGAHLLRWRSERLIYRPFEGTLEPLDQSCSSKQLPEPTRLRALPAPTLEPECLTLVCRGGCRLGCTYCYAAGDHRDAAPGPAPVDSIGSEVPDDEAIVAAARHVAQARASTGGPLVVGFHGHGEPLANPARVAHAVELCRGVAAELEIDLVLGCTTSAAIDPDTAGWLARTFDLVTVSWDGVSGAHDLQRPMPGGGGSSRVVEQTLEVLCRARRSRRAARPSHLSVRATITCNNVRDQAFMAAYLVDRFGVDRLCFQPISRHHAMPAGERRSLIERLTPEPGALVRHFVEARRVARDRGVELVMADCRVEEPHGRHCGLLQRNLLLTPDGLVSACFLDPGDEGPPPHQGLDDRALPEWPRYGKVDRAGGRVIMDPARAERLLGRLSHPHRECTDCFNLLHCAQGCPEVCPAAGNGGEGAAPQSPGPRGRATCERARLLGLVSLLEQAGIEPEPGEVEGLDVDECLGRLD